MRMNRLESYFGTIAALFVGIFIANFFDTRAMLPAPTVNTSTTSAMFFGTSDFSLLPLSSPLFSSSEVNGATATSSLTTLGSKKKAATSASAPTTASSSSKFVPISAPPPSPAPVSAIALDASASVLRSALVNIICYVPEGTSLHSISGSGVFIDSKGIILTNAHIAQYFLLANRNVSCTIRSGSPATKSYSAALIYISRAWLQANASVLTQSAPSGTGEYDFALLAVTKSATVATLPTQFPSLPLAQTPPQKDTPVIIASYGAQFLGSSQIQSALFPTIVFGSVKDVFTFAQNTIDVVALGGSAAAQEGSSGGGVANAFGELVGTITTSTIEGDTSTRSLSAITASYIRAEYASETGKALDLLLAEPTSVSVADFAPQIPELESILTAHLP